MDLFAASRHAWWSKPLAVTIATLTAVQFSAAGMFYSAELVVELLQRPQARERAIGYSSAPRNVLPSSVLGRDVNSRAGVWNSRTRGALERVIQQERIESFAGLLASTNLAVGDIAPLILGMQVGDPDGGGATPGEGIGGPSPSDPIGPGPGPTPIPGYDGGGPGGMPSYLNPNTGNRYRGVPIVGWHVNGFPVSFRLHYNTQTNYLFDIGKNWSHSFDIRVNYDPLSDIAIIRFPDGTRVPFELVSTGTNPAPGMGLPVVPWVYEPPTGSGYRGILRRWESGSTVYWEYIAQNESSVTFNQDGRATLIQDRIPSNYVQINRDSSNKIQNVVDSEGRTLTFEYATNGMISKVIAPHGKSWLFEYNTSDQLEHIAYPLLNWYGMPDPIIDTLRPRRTFTYNISNWMLSEKDLRGETWNFTYHSGGNLWQEINPLGQIWTYTYTSTQTTITRPDGFSYSGLLNAGFLVGHSDSAGYTRAYTYTPDGRIGTMIDGNGKTWSFDYDAFGFMSETTDPLGRTFEYEFDPTGLLTKVTNPFNNMLQVAYNTQGRPVTVTDELGRTTSSNSFDSNGNLVSSSDALGRTSYAVYDPFGNLTQLTMPGGIVTSASYDILGRPTSLTDASGLITTIVYDAWGRVESVTADGTTATFTYDGESAVLSSDISDGTNTRGDSFLRDALGRIVSSTNANGDVEVYTYNNVGFLIAVENGNGKIREYSYLPRGELASLELPDGTIDSWSYDAEGRVTGYTNGALETILYEYDDAGQLIKVDLPVGIDTTFAYDLLGRRTQMVDSTGTTTWGYNAASELTSLVTPQGSFTYTYNLAGQRLIANEVGHSATSYAYDAAGRMESITKFGFATTFSYDSVGRPIEVVHGNGTREEYAYDLRGRITSLALKEVASGVVLGSQSFLYDGLDQLLQHTIDGITTTYAYDNLGLLLSEIKPGYVGGYTYDANGNRLTRTINGQTESYVYDDGDKLLEVNWPGGSKLYTYDGAGRPTQITSPTGNYLFTWNSQSQLTQLTGPSGTQQFSYNGSGARASITKGGVTDHVVRDGTGVLGSIVRQGGQEFKPGVAVRDGLNTTWQHSGLKNFDWQSTGAATISGTKQFDAFGTQIGSTGTWTGPFSHAGPFGYQSDGDIPFQQVGHRWLDPTTGRFLTRDPIQDGRNWYSYGGGEYNPVNGADPTGLGWHDPTQIIVDPDFKGEVIAYGDFSWMTEDSWRRTEVLPGQRTHPDMDVDLIMIRHEDGRVEWVWLLGTRNDMKRGHERAQYYVDENGRVTAVPRKGVPAAPPISVKPGTVRWLPVWSDWITDAQTKGFPTGYEPFSSPPHHKGRPRR